MTPSERWALVAYGVLLGLVLAFLIAVWYGLL